MEVAVGKEFYDYLCSRIESSLYKTDVETFADMSVVILGSNITKEFNAIVSKLLANDNIKIYLIGSRKQIDNLHDELIKEIEIFEWNSSYGISMFDEIRQTESFSQVRRMLFLGSMNINLRDLNIIDMGVCLKREYDIDTYIYDYYDEKIYQYKDIEVYCAGMRLYKDMNEFLSLTEG